MNYGNIKYNDIGNGEGVRTSLFVSGCKNHCKGCFNQCTWDFLYGELYTEEVQQQILDSIDKPYIKGLSLLGGDPMELENQETVYGLVKAFRERFGDNKDIWMWTGYLSDVDLIEGGKRYNPDVTPLLMKEIDVIVDGPFIEKLKDLKLRFRGSSNQRIIYNRGDKNV